MDPYPDLNPDPELPEKSDPDPQIIFSYPTNWFGEFFQSIASFSNACSWESSDVNLPELWVSV